MKTRWLGRDTVRAPHLTLCLSEAEYLRVARHCNVVNHIAWLDDGHIAAVHTWEIPGKLMCIVCLRPLEGADPIEVACALVHESVHIFQRLCDSIGENEPSREFEAYSIERISEALMREYASRRG